MSNRLSEKICSKLAQVEQLFGILSLLMIAAGCTLVDSKIDLAYRVEAARKSPLSTIKPLILRVEVRDRRDVSDPQLIGYKKSSFGNVLASIKSKQEVSRVVRLALETELRNNGHAISLDNEAGFDATLAVSIKKLWTEPIVKIVDVQVLGTVNADIEVIDSVKRRIAARTIIGTQLESWQLSINDGYDRVLNGALREFVRNFARDPDLLKALRDVSTR